jgi:hypothetical protein
MNRINLLILVILACVFLPIIPGVIVGRGQEYISISAIYPFSLLHTGAIYFNGHYYFFLGGTRLFSI